MERAICEIGEPLRIGHLVGMPDTQHACRAGLCSCPREPVTLDGVPIRAAIPLGVGEAGNLTLTAVALSYADTLAVTLVADSNRMPDLELLAGVLQAELDGWTALADVPGREHAATDTRWQTHQLGEEPDDPPQ